MESHTAWCRMVFDSLNEGGTWAVPRSGLIFTKRDGKLVLTLRMPEVPNEIQDEDFELIRQHFALAEIQVVEEGA